MSKYKTVCSKCKRTYETDVKYYNYICERCEAEEKASQRKFDENLLEKARIELEEAIAKGEPQSKIDALTELYNSWYNHCLEKYGSSTR